MLLRMSHRSAAARSVNRNSHLSKFRLFPDWRPIRLVTKFCISLLLRTSAMNSGLVSAVLQFLTPVVVERLGAASGLETATAQKTATVLVPSLLSGLAVLAAKPSGAQQLETTVADQPIDTLESFACKLPGSALQAAMGTSVLYSLLGGSPLGMLTSAVRRFTGSREGSVRTLAGLLTPLILSVLGREQRAAGLDAHGLARMLVGSVGQIT